MFCQGSATLFTFCSFKFDELEDSCQEREEQLAQAQQDADEMADMVRKMSSASQPT